MQWRKIKSYIVGPYKYEIKDLDKYDRFTRFLVRKPWVPAAVGGVLGLVLGILCASVI